MEQVYRVFLCTYLHTCTFVNKANISNYISGEKYAFGSMEPLQKYLIIATLPNAKYVHLLSPASAVGVPY